MHLALGCHLQSTYLRSKRDFQWIIYLHSVRLCVLPDLILFVDHIDSALVVTSQMTAFVCNGVTDVGLGEFGLLKAVPFVPAWPAAGNALSSTCDCKHAANCCSLQAASQHMVSAWTRTSTDACPRMRNLTIYTQ